MGNLSDWYEGEVIARRKKAPAPDAQPEPVEKSQKELIREQIKQQQDGLDQMLAKNKERWAAERQRDTYTGPMGMFAQPSQYYAGAIPKEQKQAEAVHFELDRARKALDTYTKKDQAKDIRQGKEKRFYAEALDGLGNTTFSEVSDIVTLGFASTQNQSKINAALEKASQGKQLTEIEQLIVDARSSTGGAERYVADQGGATAWHSIGQSLPGTAQFMAETATTGGMAGVGKAVVGGGAKAIGRALGGAAAKEAIRTPLRGSMWQRFGERTGDQYFVQEDGTVGKEESSVAAQLYKSYMSTFVEGFTEQLGNVAGSGLLAKGAGKIAPKLLGKKMGGALVNGVERLAKATEVTRDLFKRTTNYNGTIDELGEEIVNNAIEPLLTGEPERIRETLSSENLLVTLGSVALVGSVMHSAELPSIVRHELQGGKLRRQTNGAVAAIEDQALRQGVFDALKKGQTVEQKATQLASLDWGNVSQTDAAHVVDAFSWNLRHELFKGVDQEQTTKEQYAHQYAIFNAEYQKVAHRETGVVQELLDDEGGTHYLLSGSLDDASADNTVFVLDAQTGETRQLDRNRIEHVIPPLTYGELLDKFNAQNIEPQATELDDVDAEAAEARVSPVGYAQGETVDLADGRTGDFIGYMPDGITAQVAIEDELTGEPNTIEVHKGQIVGLSEVAEISTEATAPVVEQEGSPVVQEPTIPLQKDGTPDYDAMPAAQFLEEYGKVHSPQEAVGFLENESKLLGKHIDKIKKGSQSLSRNTQERNLRKIVELQTRLDDIASVIGEKVAPIAVAQAPSVEATIKPSQRDQVFGFGDPASLRDYVLRDIVQGKRFRWKDEGASRGLASALGFVGKEVERRVRIGLLKKDGDTPERYAEHLTAEVAPQFGITDYHEVRDEVVDILRSVNSRGKARKILGELHGNLRKEQENEIAYAEHLQEQAKQLQEQNEKEWADARAEMDLYYDNLTEEEIKEKDSLFEEESLPLYQDGNKERILQQPITRTPETLGYDDNQRGDGIEQAQGLYSERGDTTDGRGGEIRSGTVGSVGSGRSGGTTESDPETDGIRSVEVGVGGSPNTGVRNPDYSPVEQAAEKPSIRDTSFAEPNPKSGFMGDEPRVVLESRSATQPAVGIYEDSEQIRHSDLRRDGSQDAGVGRSLAEGDEVADPSEVRFSELPDDYTAEMERIKSDALERGDFMRAPNGQPTHLTEDQWLQVRTEPFKKWFGDWERAARIEKLRVAEPIAITGKEITPSDDLKQYKRNALEYGKSLRGEYVNADTGIKIVLNRESLTEILHHDYKDSEHLQSIAAIPQIIENGIFVAEEKSEANDKIDSVEYFVSGLVVGGAPYTVKSVVTKSKNGTRYYDHKLTQIEKGELIDLMSAISSAVSKTNNSPKSVKPTGDAPIPPSAPYKDKRLLSILQVDASKIVDENGEPLVVYHGTDSAFYKFKHSKARYGEGSFFFAQNEEDAASYSGDGNTMSVFINLRRPADFENLPDANLNKLDSKREIVKALAKLGYDGWASEMETGWGEVSAFHPNQVKSATDNTGEFSNKSDDIRFKSNVADQIFAETERQQKHEADKLSKKQSSTDRRVAIDQALQKLTQQFGVETVQVDTIADLPAPLRSASKDRRFSGLYHKPTGAVYLIGSELHGADHATATYLHEVVAHKGVDGLLGQERAARFYAAVFDALKPEEQGRLLADYKSKLREGEAYNEQQARIVAGDEVVARMAEGDVTPGTMQRIIAAVRRFFREVLGVPLTISDTDIRYILFKSKISLQRTANLADAMKAIEADQRMRAVVAMDELRAKERAPLEQVNDQFNQELVYLQSGRLRFGHVFSLGMPSEALQLAGVPVLPIELEAVRLQKKSEQAEHPFGLNTVRNLPEALARPIMVFDSKRGANNKVVLTELSDGKMNFVVAIQTAASTQRGRQVLEINDVRSLYPKEFGRMVHWIEGGLMRWVDKPKALAFLEQNGSAQKKSDDTNVARPNASGIRRSYYAEATSPDGFDPARALVENPNELVSADHSDFVGTANIVQNFKNPIFEDSIRYSEIGSNTKPIHPYRAAGKKGSWGSKAIQFQEAMQDATIKVHMLQKEVKQGGGVIDSFTNAYEAFNHVDSRVDAAMRKYKRHYMEPITTWIRKWRTEYDVEYDDVTDYLLAKHSLERHASGISALDEKADGLWTKEHATKLVDRFEGVIPALELSEFWAHWRAATNEVLEICVRSGRMSLDEKREILGNGWQYYVPLRGKDFDFEQVADMRDVYHYDMNRGGGGSSINKRIADVKAKGRISKSSEPISVLQHMASTEIYLSEQNNALRTFLRLAESNPERTDLFSVRQQWHQKQSNGTWVMITDTPTPEEIATSKAARIELREIDRNLIQNMRDGLVSFNWYKKEGDKFTKTEKSPTKEEIKISSEAIQELRAEKDKAKREDIKKRITVKLQKEYDQEFKVRREELSKQITVSLRERDAGKVYAQTGVQKPSNKKDTNKTYTGAPEGANWVSVMKDGIRYTIELVDPEVAAAINYATSDWQNSLSRTIGRITRTVAQLSTSKNPTFMLPNLVRDFRQAALYHFVDSDGDLGKFLKYESTSSGTIHRATTNKARPLTMVELGTLDVVNRQDRKKLIGQYGKKRVFDTLYDLFDQGGGSTGFVYIPSSKDAMRKLEKNTRRSAKKWSDDYGLNVPRKLWGGFNYGLDYVGQMSENITRFASFMAVLDKGKSTFDAVSYAKNVTVNFNRKGKLSKGFGATYMFFNANIQGVVNQASLVINKNMKDKKTMRAQRARFALVHSVNMMLGFAQKMGYYRFMANMVSGDDEEYTISDYVLRTNNIIPCGELGYLKIPIPISDRSTFGLGSLMADLLMGKISGVDVGVEFFKMLKDSFSPLPVDYQVDKDQFASVLKMLIPQFIKPFAEVWINENFMGIPISRETPFNEDDPDSSKGAKNATVWSKSISRFLNALGGGDEVAPAGLMSDGSISMIPNFLDVSPSSLDHYFKGYTGGWGRIAMQVAAMIYDGEVETAKFPISDRFYGEASEKSPYSEYYELKRRVERIHKVNKKAKEKGLSRGSDEQATKNEVWYNRLRGTERRQDGLFGQRKWEVTGSEAYDVLEKKIWGIQREFIKEYNAQDND